MPQSDSRKRTPDDFARAIVALRGNRSQADVARRAGIHPAIWSLYEGGRRRPRRHNLRKVLLGLGCSRLEFEEVRWELRRGQLIRQERMLRAIEEGDPSLASTLQVRLPAADDEASDPEPDEVLAAQIHAAAVRLAGAIKEVLVLLLRA